MEQQQNPGGDPDSPPGAAGTAPPPDGRPLVYDGRSGALFWLGARVALLSLITFGIYTFWGKTRIRRYLWGHMTLMGDRLRYTGTGKELFVGFLIVIVVLTPLGFLSGVMDFWMRSTGAGFWAQGIYLGVQYLVYLYLIGLAIFLARRYRLSRTVWRGIRFGQTGSAMRYALLFFGWSLAVALTLGLILPLMSVSLTRYEVNNTWLGNRHFRFDGGAGELFKSWIFCWLLLPFTAGLSYFWYRIRLTRFTAAHSRIEGVGFALPIRLRNAWSVLIPAALVNLLYVAAFAGLGFAISPLTVPGAPPPEQAAIMAAIGFFVFVMLFGRALVLAFVTHRYIALIARRLEIAGEMDFSAILQSLQPRPGTGEGLASALDVGAGLDAGL